MCGSDTYNVHKAIVCPQSDFFRAACRPDTFAEGNIGVIDIPASSGRADAFYAQPFNAEEFDWDLDVETTESVKLMIHYFYHHDYKGRVSHLYQKFTAQCRDGILSEHSRMYAMGEKYGIPGLKAVARTKFRDASMSFLGHAGLAAAIIIAFKSTPETVKGLRTDVLEALYQSRGWYTNDEEVWRTVASIPELAYDLFRKILQREIAAQP